MVQQFKLARSMCSRIADAQGGYRFCALSWVDLQQALYGCCGTFIPLLSTIDWCNRLIEFGITFPILLDYIQTLPHYKQLKLLSRDLKMHNKRRNKDIFAGGREMKRKEFALKKSSKSVLDFFLLHCCFPKYIGKAGFYCKHTIVPKTPFKKHSIDVQRQELHFSS